MSAGVTDPCGLGPMPASELKRAGILLQPWIKDVRDAYLACGLDKIKKTQIVVTEAARDGRRHFAACRDDGMKILLAPQLLLLPAATTQAIIAHEFGHAADYLYPAAFQRVAIGQVRFTEYGHRTNDGVPSGVADRWRARGADDVEMDADAIAEWALSRYFRQPVRIGYAGPCMLETIGAGIRPRPRGLR